MKEVAQFPLKPLYLESDKWFMSLHVSSWTSFSQCQPCRNTLTLSYWWLFPHQWASSPLLKKTQKSGSIVLFKVILHTSEIFFIYLLLLFLIPNLACQWPAGCPQSYGRPSAGKRSTSAQPPSLVSSGWSLCRPWLNTWQSRRSAPPLVWRKGCRWTDGGPGRWEWSWWKQETKRLTFECFWVLCCIHLTSCGVCHSLWDLAKGFDRLGHSGVCLDVFSCSILDLALLHRSQQTTDLLSALEGFDIVFIVLT